MSLRKEAHRPFFRLITLQKCICYTCINVFLQNTKESLDNILSTVQLYTGFVPNVIFNCNYVNLCESIEKEADSDCSNGGFFLSLISQILHCLSSPHPVAAHLIVIIERSCSSLFMWVYFSTGPSVTLTSCNHHDQPSLSHLTVFLSLICPTIIGGLSPLQCCCFSCIEFKYAVTGRSE